ncbi:CpsD/CapB family tyrosine-protein kinase [Acidobacteria bacterium AB60]|nr:CpsD/CapB family tyrosine-protein kinase [Acidobacteria bacterium AB60]
MPQMRNLMSRIHEALIRAEQEHNGRPGAPANVTLPPFNTSALLQPQALGMPSMVESEKTHSDNAFSRVSRPDWQAANGNMLFLQEESQVTPWAEQFRAIRSRLYRIRQKQTLKIILVTSSLPREGKSFLSANLSQIFARQRGCRTLLVDADLRWPRLHEYLGAPCNPGLPDYLAGTASAFSIVQQSPVPDLFFIPGGPARSPAELMSNGKMKGLLDELEPHFEWIVIDSPPVSVVSDVASLAAVSHGIVLVVRSGFTRFGVVQHAREELKDRPLVGVVLNAASKNESTAAYHYYGHDAASPDGMDKENQD